MNNNNFNPNWASPPGNTIDELVKAKNISYNKLAESLNTDTEFLKNLIYGNVPLSNEIAEKLAVHLGASSKFWINRESLYRQTIKELKVNEEKKWMKGLPVKEMVNNGWINKDYSVDSLLTYFNVSNVWAWKAKYKQLASATAFRTSPSFEANFMATCSWLRQAEIQASKIDCKPYDSLLFQQKLQEIKKLTRKKKPKDFIFKLQSLCAECGVAISFVKSPKGCTASGAAYFLSKEKALIILSFRYLKDDQFWFTFFHEAGHIILHNKNVFIEELSHDGLDDNQEKEANDFSSNILLSQNARRQLSSLPLTVEGILRFALENGVSPGIIIGQLQHSRRITFQQLNRYKRSYDWDEISMLINIDS